MNETGKITGTILRVRDYGSLVVLDLGAGDGWVLPVPLEHRPFQWLLEGEGCTAGELVGRSVCCEGDSILFLD
jgi:hypothetical protein